LTLLLMLPPPPTSRLSPYTTLFRSSQPISQTANIANIIQSTIADAERVFELLDEQEEEPVENPVQLHETKGAVTFEQVDFGYGEDRKSTRLNSSHVSISYAVFCLKN